MNTPRPSGLQQLIEKGKFRKHPFNTPETAFEAGIEFAWNNIPRETVGGVRWVKASERLPKHAGDPQIHYRIDGFHKVNGNFHYSIDDETCAGEIVFTVIGGYCHADYQIPKEKWSGLEWLEERPSESPAITNK